VNSIDFNLP